VDSYFSINADVGLAITTFMTAADNLPAGPYVRITALNTDVTIGGAHKLHGDFYFDQATGKNGTITRIAYRHGRFGNASLDRASEHNERNADTNGHAHIRAALLGPSVTVPVRDGRLALGTWQRVVCVDSDDRPRTRTVVVQLLGD